MKQKILITGSNGQLGCCLRNISLLYSDFEFKFTDIDELDVTQRDKVSDFIQEFKPDWVINCVGYESVDAAETNVEKAELLNVEIVKNLVDSCKSVKAGFINISSDYVFDGTNPEPLSEETQVNPLSVYGRTKLESEKIALGYSKSVVFRSGSLFSEYGNNVLKDIIQQCRDNNEINMSGDQWGTPTSAHDLSKAIMTVISDPTYGLYHFSNEGLTSWALFAEEVISKCQIECTVNHVAADRFDFKAIRPVYTILSKKKFSKAYKVDIPEWETALELVIQKL